MTTSETQARLSALLGVTVEQIRVVHGAVENF